MKKTKEEILIVAANLFLSKGFEATTTAEIARVVGLCHSGLFSHFKSKEEIYRKFVEIFFLNKQDPNLKFQKIEGTFIDFIDAYIVGVASTMKSLASFNKGNVTSADYLMFMLAASKKYDDCAQNYLNQDQLVFNLWKSQIEASIKRKEIREDINVELIVKMFMFTFYGSSYISAFEKGLNPQYLKEIYYGYYELIKLKK